MASEEAKFAARADRLAGARGVVGFVPSSVRDARFAPQDRYILPQFEEKTPYGYKRQDPYTRLFEDRIIFMGVQVDDAAADDIMAQLLVLESQDPNRDVMMYINSPGGSMTAMTAIYDTMQYIKPDVQTVCLGQAASAAAILLAAGAKGKRLILPNARVLIHQPAIDQGLRQGHGDRDPGPRDAAHARMAGEHTGQAHRPGRRTHPQGHRGRHLPDRPRGQGIRIVDEVLEHRS